MVGEIHTYVAIVCCPCFGAKVQDGVNVGGVFDYSSVVHMDHRLRVLVPAYCQYTILTSGNKSNAKCQIWT